MKPDTSIIELYAEAFKSENFTPNTGRILRLLFSSNQKYYTFQELQDTLQISKSAVSKSLKELTQFGEVSSKLVEGSNRKRSFYIDPKSYVKRFKLYMDGWHMQTQLYKETLQLRNDENEELNNFIEKMINFNESVFMTIEEKLREYFESYQ